MTQHKLGLSVLTIFLLIVGGCTTEETGSLFDPGYVTKPPPAITSIQPPTGLAGTTVLTIAGSNFSATKEDNFVYFDARLAEVLEASPTQLRVRAPNVSKDSILVRVGVHKVEQFSNTLLYKKLEPAVSEFGSLQPLDEPWGITADAQGNVYVSMMTTGVGIGVKRFTPVGVRSDYAPSGGITKWSGMKMGPGGVLYTARTLRVIYQIPAAGAAPVIWVAFGNLGTVHDFDFDAAKNIWAGGNNPAVYRIKPDRDVKVFPFSANVRSVRVFGAHVYFAGLVFPDSSERVVRFRIISADSLGPAEDYFNLTTSPLGGRERSIYAITFSLDGNMFVGTDGPNPMILVRPTRTAESFYPGLLSPAIHLFAWGNGPYLYAVQGAASGGLVSASRKIFRVNTELSGAAYHGIQ